MCDASACLKQILIKQLTRNLLLLEDQFFYYLLARVWTFVRHCMCLATAHSSKGLSLFFSQFHNPNRWCTLYEELKCTTFSRVWYRNLTYCEELQPLTSPWKHYNICRMKKTNTLCSCVVLCTPDTWTWRCCWWNRLKHKNNRTVSWSKQPLKFDMLNSNN